MMCKKDLKDIKAKYFLEVVYHHAKSGVDFMTIHARIILALLGFLRSVIELLI